MAIKCCKDCIPPKRYPGCHSKCPEYQAEKEVHDRLKAEEFKRSRTNGELLGQKIERIIRNKRQQRPYIMKRRVK